MLQCVQSEDLIIYVPYRCTRKEQYCIECKRHRRAVLFAKLMERWGLNEQITRLGFGTIGTNWKDTARNRVRLSEAWQLFRKIMNKNTKWNPLFKVVEKGKKGYLHIHFLYQSYVHREFVREEWSRITKITKPHVWLQEVHFKYDNIVRTLWYVTKYVTKEASAYSWLGDFYGKYSKDKIKDSTQCAHFRFWYIREGVDLYTVQGTLDRSFIAGSVRFNYRKHVWEVKY